MNEHTISAAIEVAKKALREGYRVWLSNNGKGDYGLIATADGSRVISFDDDFGIRFCGCYGPPSPTSGTGWRLEDGSFAEMLAQTPPAACGSGWQYLETVEQHIAEYPASSYREMTLADLENE